MNACSTCRIAVTTLTSLHQKKPTMAITRIQPLSAHLHPRAVAATPAAGKQQQQAVYTVWMKSLVLGGHGCTVYGDDGRVAYRVDNYACSRSREAYVMDGDGRTLLKLLKKVSACMHMRPRPPAALLRSRPIATSLTRAS
jgi:hypothetical protein